VLTALVVTTALLSGAYQPHPIDVAFEKTLQAAPVVGTFALTVGGGAVLGAAAGIGAGMVVCTVTPTACAAAGEPPMPIGAILVFGGGATAGTVLGAGAGVVGAVAVLDAAE
jgi:hypothetical protein